MSDISSFNQLFVEAARRGLRLNSFHQLDSGLFRANWRIDRPKPWFGPAAEHAQPFLAVHNAYVLADLQAPSAKPVTISGTICADPSIPEEGVTFIDPPDLFG